MNDGVEFSDLLPSDIKQVQDLNEILPSCEKKIKVKIDFEESRVTSIHH